TTRSLNPEQVDCQVSVCQQHLKMNEVISVAFQESSVSQTSDRFSGSGLVRQPR
uniref:Uncharacterized protein n=1 Tax=Sparus aurata TaxID=8175 RepID=A0A671TTH1_SPAAU